MAHKALRRVRSFLAVVLTAALIGVGLGSPVGNPALLSHEGATPAYSAAEVARMGAGALGRSLLQDEQLPICELDMTYRVLQADSSSFLSLVTLTNNREVNMGHWQVVWRFEEPTAVALGGAEGAIVLSSGGPGGSPVVRLVDTYTSDGIEAGGGSYTFLAAGEFLAPPATGNESLLIEDTNFNGLRCTLAHPQGSLRQPGGCRSGQLGGPDADDNPSDCRAAFCCGVVLLNPGAPPPPPPPVRSPPPPSLPPGGSSSPPPGLDASGSPRPAPPAPPGDAGSSREEHGSRRTAAAVAASVGGTVGIALTALGVLWGLRYRRRLLVHRASFSMAANDPTAGREQHAGKGEEGGQQGPHPAGTLATIRLITAATGKRAAHETGGGQAGCSCNDCISAVGQSETGLAGRVEFGEQLGAGAFGRVYKGTWAGRQVAVKLLQTACASSSRELHSFRQEVAVLSQLRHPNIVAFLAACTVPPDICIVEELVEGGSLHDSLHGRHGARGRRRRQPLPYKQLLEIGMDVASAMVYLHPGVVHRDLKSQNVLLDNAGRAKVCDFGIAKFKDRTFVSTANGQAGTPAYMAPEQFDGHRITEKVDVYSFAILLWEMLTGEMPWHNVPTAVQIIYYVGVLQQRPPLPPACPPALRALVERCWADDPSARPAFTEIFEALRCEHAAHLATLARQAQQVPQQQQPQPQQPQAAVETPPPMAEAGAAHQLEAAADLQGGELNGHQTGGPSNRSTSNGGDGNGGSSAGARSRSGSGGSSSSSSSTDACQWPPPAAASGC